MLTWTQLVYQQNSTRNHKLAFQQDNDDSYDEETDIGMIESEDGQANQEWHHNPQIKQQREYEKSIKSMTKSRLATKSKSKAQSGPQELT